MVIADCSPVPTKKSLQAENHLPGKERSREKVFWTVHPFRPLRYEMLYHARVIAEMGVAMVGRKRHSA